MTALEEFHQRCLAQLQERRLVLVRTQERMLVEEEYRLAAETQKLLTQSRDLDSI